ncbi:MAG: SynChlorMet cassette protein ScmC [Deltaproteobacteria bacterium]|nr:SynChlorMet cassette protein ScmC [Deltaproteobacteria bacterium]
MTRGYRLALGGGPAWTIVADAGAAEWLDEFARILQLPACSPGGASRLIVTRDAPREGSAAPVVRESRFVRFFQRPGSPDVTCVIGGKENHVKEHYKMWELLLPVHESVGRRGGMPFHAALLEKDGAGVLLSACGGTGKSTCARRAPAPWRALSDDECLIVRNGDAGYLVHPLPTWSVYLRKLAAPVWDVGTAVRLAGIFFLKQADRDEAVPLGAGEAVLRAYDAGQQVCQYGLLAGGKGERQVNARMLDNAGELVRRVPAYTLGVSLAGSFWEEIERVLTLS